MRSFRYQTKSLTAYYEINHDSHDFILSIGKLHGDEFHSSYGIYLSSLIHFFSDFEVSFVGIPEANPLSERLYNGIDLCSDFGSFKTKISKNIDKIIRKYEPKLIIDHHDNLAEQEFLIILPNNFNNREYTVAKRIVEEIQTRFNISISNVPSIRGFYSKKIIGEIIEPGIYRIDEDSNKLISFYHNNDIDSVLVEVPVINQDILIHSVCDIIATKSLTKNK